MTFLAQAPCEISMNKIVGMCSNEDFQIRKHITNLARLDHVLLVQNTYYTGSLRLYMTLLLAPADSCTVNVFDYLRFLYCKFKIYDYILGHKKGIN